MHWHPQPSPENDIVLNSWGLILKLWYRFALTMCIALVVLFLADAPQAQTKSTTDFIASPEANRMFGEAVLLYRQAASEDVATRSQTYAQVRNLLQQVALDYPDSRAGRAILNDLSFAGIDRALIELPLATLMPLPGTVDTSTAQSTIAAAPAADRAIQPAPSNNLSSSYVDGIVFGQYRARFTQDKINRIVASAKKSTNKRLMNDFYQVATMMPNRSADQSILLQFHQILKQFADINGITIEDLKLFNDGRNLHQDQFATIDMVANRNVWTLLPPEESAFHSIGYDPSTIRKYVSTDGKEYVFHLSDGAWVFISDGVNTGTYNYGSGNYAHTILDIIPWVIWGIGAQETQTPEARLSAMRETELTDLFVGNLIAFIAAPADAVSVTTPAVGLDVPTDGMVATDGFLGVSSGAIVPSAQSTKTGLVDGLYTTDPGLCYPDNQMYESAFISLRNIGNESVIFGYEDKCSIERSAQTGLSSELSGTCYFGSDASQQTWNWQVHSSTEFTEIRGVYSEAGGFRNGQRFNLCASESRGSLPATLISSTTVLGEVVGSQPVTSTLQLNDCSLISRVDADSFFWTGACVGGVIAGSGELSLFKQGLLQERLSVGDGTEFRLDDGTLHWIDQLDLVFEPGEVLKVSISHYATSFVIAPMGYNYQYQPTVNRIMTAAYQDFITNRGFVNTDVNRTGFSAQVISEEHRGTSSMHVLSLMDRLGVPRTDDPWKFGYQNDALSDFDKEKKTFNDNVAAQNAARAEADQKAMIKKMRTTAEQRWNSAWTTEIASNGPWGNIADLIRFDKGRTIAGLAAGHDILVKYEDVSFSNGQAAIINWQPLTNIYEGIPVGRFSWDNWFDQTQSAGNMAGVMINCAVENSMLEVMQKGENSVVSATLRTLQDGGMRPSVYLDCELK